MSTTGPRNGLTSLGSWRPAIPSGLEATPTPFRERIVFVGRPRWSAKSVYRLRPRTSRRGKSCCAPSSSSSKRGPSRLPSLPSSRAHKCILDRLTAGSIFTFPIFGPAIASTLSLSMKQVRLFSFSYLSPMSFIDILATLQTTTIASLAVVAQYASAVGWGALADRRGPARQVTSTDCRRSSFQSLMFSSRTAPRSGPAPSSSRATSSCRPLWRKPRARPARSARTRGSGWPSSTCSPVARPRPRESSSPSPRRFASTSSSRRTVTFRLSGRLRSSTSPILV